MIWLALTPIWICLCFPSHTDTFGNVVLEALASGVPAIVTPDGGPRYIVKDGETGCIATDDGFSGAIASLILDPELHARMRRAARVYAQSASWDSVFEGVYSTYEEVLARGMLSAEPRETQIPPLRCAPVGMTKGRAVFSLSVW